MPTSAVQSEPQGEPSNAKRGVMYDSPALIMLVTFTTSAQQLRGVITLRMTAYRGVMDPQLLKELCRRRRARRNYA